ncbi:hypothetical protein FOBRF1_013715 [Fusarium oxysporum]
MLREVCEASITGRLQLFYPLNPAWNLEELDGWILEVGWSVCGGWGTLDFRWMTQNDEEVRPSEELTLFATKGCEASEAISNSPLQAKIDLVEARNWLQECQLTHEKCNQSARPAAEPKRLIYVGGSSESTALIESLVEPVGHYAALSYCWGDISQNYFRTTQETLARRLQGFNINDLPKTIQDAVKVTRALGLEYIWVDVLCIVQDDPEDMNEEMSHMGRIYQNAAVTISASRASHSNEGFLHERTLETTDKNTFAIRWSNLDNSDRSRGQMVLCTEAEIGRNKPDPVDTRAWTMQEHMLSSRLLRFGKSQTVWECLESICVDGGSEDKKPPPWDMAGEVRRAVYDWQQAVAQFTARSITKTTDRLPAIAAVAEDYASKIGAKPSDYLAGLWRQGLPFMLLWRIESKTAPRTCPALPAGQRLFPTWSWHMARSGVSWPSMEPAEHSDPMLLKVLSHDIMLETETVQYGRVKTASLTVSASTLPGM